MAEIIEMPKLSDTMEEGTIAAWHKEIGDVVKAGELMVEIETDKATMELESFRTGVLLHRGADKGGTIALGDLLAIIGEKGEKIDELLAKYTSGKTVSKPEVVSAGTEKTQTAEPVVSSQKESSSSPSNGDGRVKASPLAKVMAKEAGLEIGGLRGSGDGGRIVRRDIEAALTTAPPAAKTSVSGRESFREEMLSQMRKTIAKRLSESKFNSPHFYLTMEIDMEKTVAARSSINEKFESRISFNDFVIKATALALKRHPVVNSSFLGDRIRYNDHVHIGMAVAVPDGLIVPVIRFADGKSLGQISAEAKELAGKAREKKLQPAEMSGNTFTISNLGMFGIEEFTAIINPPDSCIMAIGGIVDKPVVKNGAVVPGKTMKVTLSCDHRSVDGASGSEFLQTLKGFLEDPVRMLA